MFVLFKNVFFFSGGAPQPSSETNGRTAPIAPIRKSSTLSSAATRTPTSNQTAVASPLVSPLNNSLNNILNYSPPQYLNKNNVTKSNSSIISNSNTNNLTTDPNKLNASSSTGNVSETKTKSSSSNDNVNSGSTHKIYGSSLLCYQNVPPPSPTNSQTNDNNSKTNGSPKTSDDSKKESNSSSAITLAALLPGDSTTLPVKKRTKLRHRLSDVGSWGLRRKDRAHKYRSMNIESLEVLGDPVIEDTFFVSIFIIFFCFCFNFYSFKQLDYRKKVWYSVLEWAFFDMISSRKFIRKL